MANEFKLPELGENVSTGNVTKVMIAPGDKVKENQPIVELETDKAVIEVPSTVSGVVEQVRVQDGDTVKVGQVLFTMSSDGTPPKEEAAAPKEEKKAEPAKAEKAQESEPAPEEDAPPKQQAEPADEAEEKERASAPARRSEERRPAARPAAERAAPPLPPRRRAPGQAVAASPSVRRLAREIGVDINEVAPSDPAGRITVDDVKEFARAINTDVQGMAPRPAAQTVELPDFTRWGEVEYEELNMVRRRTAENMAAAWATIPHVTQFDQADITDLERFRKKYAKRVEQEGGKLTVTAIVVKIVAGALKRFPQFNSSLDPENNELILKKYYNIGVAVDTDRGLIVPVIHDADRKSLIEVAVALTEIAERARTRKTKLEEMQGGTFTISNLGGIGGTGFTPIVNAPEAAILGIARSRIAPVYIDGKFEPRTIMPLALSYDHRVIDGADGARFLRWIAEAIEEPLLQFLEG